MNAWIKCVCIAGVAALLGVVPGGCEKEPVQAPASTQPATVPAAVPTTAPATLVLTIDGKPFTFAAAVAVVDQEDKRLTLFSREQNQTGSFDLEMPLDETEPGPDGWSTEMQLQQDERQETPIGIELTAADQTLQPVSLKLKARPVGAKLIDIDLEGTFLVYPGDSSVASTRVNATGHFLAQRGEETPLASPADAPATQGH